MVSLKPESRWVFPCFFERNGFITNSAYVREGGLVFSSLWLHSFHRAFYVSRNITWGRSQLVHTWYRTQSYTHSFVLVETSSVRDTVSSHPSAQQSSWALFLSHNPISLPTRENEPKSPQSKAIHKAWTWLTSTSVLGSHLLRGLRELVFSVLWGLKSPLCKCGEKRARRNWKQPSLVASSKTCLSSRGLLGHCYFVLTLWEHIINPLLQIRELSCFCSGMTAMLSHYCPASLSVL